MQTDYATDKRTKWIQQAQESPLLEMLTMWDLLLVFVLIELVLAVLVLA